MAGNRAGDGPAVLADEHEHRAHHHFAPVLGRRARPQFAADADGGDIGDPHRDAAAFADDDIGDVLHLLGATGDPQQPLRAVVLDEPGAAVVVVAPESVEHVGVGHAEGQQPGRVRRHQDLLLVAADGIDLDDAGHAQELRPDDPVVDGSQVRGRHRRAVGVERARLGIDGEHEDLAQAGGDGAQGRLQPRGYRRSRRVQAFPHLLPCEVDVGAFLEHHRDLGEPVAGQGARVVEPRQPGHGVLDGKGDPLFDLQRGIAGRGGVDGDLYVGDVGHRVDGQAGKVPRPQSRG